MAAGRWPAAAGAAWPPGASVPAEPQFCCCCCCCCCCLAATSACASSSAWASILSVFSCGRAGAPGCTSCRPLSAAGSTPLLGDRCPAAAAGAAALLDAKPGDAPSAPPSATGLSCPQHAAPGAWNCVPLLPCVGVDSTAALQWVLQALPSSDSSRTASSCESTPWHAVAAAHASPRPEHPAAASWPAGVTGRDECTEAAPATATVASSTRTLCW